MKADNQMFHQHSGEILRMALHIESQLDFFIANYFCSPQNHKIFLLEDLILTNFLGFGRKITIFKGICENEGIEKEHISQVVKAIEFVQQIRNKVAHYEAFVTTQEEGIKLQKRKSVTYKKDELKLTNELLKEVQQEKKLMIGN